MTNARRDLIFCLVVLAVAVVVGWVAFGYSLKASYFPRILSIFLGAMAVALLLRTKLAHSSVPGDQREPEAPSCTLDMPAEGPSLMAAFRVFGAVVAYGLTIWLVNYELATVLFLALGMVALGMRKVMPIAAVSLGVTAALYGIFFELLGVARPESVFF